MMVKNIGYDLEYLLMFLFFLLLSYKTIILQPQLEKARRKSTKRYKNTMRDI